MRVLRGLLISAALVVRADDSAKEPVSTKEPAATKEPTPTKAPKKPGRSTPASDNCMTTCGTLPECMSAQLQTFCLNDGTCLGLYKRPNKKVCYQIGTTDTCGNGEKSPLPCSALITTTTPMPDPCIGWCTEVADCDMSPAGSFCQGDGTCYGLYDRISQPRCYAFFGQGCGLVSPLIPVSCGIYTTTTPDPCVTTTTVDPCESTTTPDPCTPTTPCPGENGKRAKATKEDDALKWYYEQLLEFQKQSALQPRFDRLAAEELAAERWGTRLLTPSGPAVCEEYCRNSAACAIGKTSCVAGVCSKLFVNSLGKVCYKSHPRACLSGDFTQVTC